MEYTRLGATGLSVSRICLGMMSYGSPSWREWVLELDASRPLVRAAVDAGVIFFDTADMYSLGASEEVTRTLLGEFFPARDDYVLATKVFNPMSDGPAVADVAKARGLRPAQVALAWVLQRKAVTAPIIGATKPGHVEDAIAALDVELDEDEVASLEAPYVPHPVLGHE